MNAGFGPLGPRAVTVRPTADVDSYGGLQTWYKDCSGAGAVDGTVPDASWFNTLIGNLNYAALKAGVSLAQDQNNDTYLYQIINSLISARLAAYSASGTGVSTGPAWTLI